MHTTQTEDDGTQAAHTRSRGRISLIVLVIFFVAFLLVALLPPLVNVSRFQKRIAANISAALGRPVHFDKVSLTLLPLPGFTLKTFVIDEDPAFGYEPILRADEVQVTLRISSLWHPHVEFSKIAFTEPSVNIVHAANGKWNIESLLLQASHIQAAPTGQRFAGRARRFPYIEATGARVNLKFDQEKTPVSLSDADFALWLPDPHQWRLRLRAHPMRTDTSPGDTGTIRAEGTLGGAGLNVASLDQIPIDLRGDWQDAQLGGLGRLFLGRDPDLRGDLSLSFAMLGTVGHNTITTDIKLANARRADFVPAHMLSLELGCQAVAGEMFHSFTSIECHWPPADSSDRGILIATGNLPNVRALESASAKLTVPAVPADTLFYLLGVATVHPPAILEGAGTFQATLDWSKDGSTNETARPAAGQQQTAPNRPALSGEMEFSGGSLETDPEDHRSIRLGDVVLRSTSAAPPAPRQPKSAHRVLAALQNAAAGSSFDLLPISLDLGGKQAATLEGHVDANGYTLHLYGSVICANLIQLGKAVPQIGDGLEDALDELAGVSPNPGEKADAPGSETAKPLPESPIRVDLTATRAWGSAQVWRQTVPAVAGRPKRR